jgi:hypothetical protein
MRRLITLILLPLLLSVGLGEALGQGDRSSPNVLDGAYEFVSEKVVLTEPADALPPPNKRYSSRTSQDWTGQWLLSDGRFSTIMMKKTRPNFLDDLGYEATGGSYTIKEAVLSLKHELMLSPLERMPYHDMTFRLEGETLTLVETFHPFNPHIAYGGTRTIVLRRIRPNKAMNRTRN